MTISVHITAAAKDDIPAILRLYAQSEIDNGKALDIKDALAIYERFSHYPRYALYAAKIGETIVGTFELLIMDNLAHQGKPSAVIEDVVVDASYRSQGIGRLMMQHAMEVAQSHGCYKMTLSSNIIREGAHHFYERLGFKKHGYSFLIEW